MSDVTGASDPEATAEPAAPDPGATAEPAAPMSQGMNESIAGSDPGEAAATAVTSPPGQVAAPSPGGNGAQPPVPTSRWRRHGQILWGEWLKPLLVIGLVMFSFRSAVADWNDVPTGSMKPTILEGDRIFINKIAYDLKFPFTRWRLAQWKDPDWGDVVVLRSPEDGKRLVKRVVGLPGDVIEIRRNHLYRNGEPATYRMLKDDFDGYLDMEPMPALYTEGVEGREHPIMILGSGLHPPGPFYVPEGEFFVMGDNRNNSRDSRYFGPVDRSAILGRATAVALSLDREDYYKPRWDRFFSKMD